ncbi:right-handed parallel beta-helix repeat-containing protein, partial [candidate division KSB1 bacterium]|nr:right-handed parallel beta-helix repeat-containing protein [candidate division KSB1 bacterium]
RDGDRDADIDSDASLFISETAYPLLRRFYLRDEPRYNGYQPFNYVDQFILNNVNIQGSANGRGRGITATPNYSQGDPTNVYAGFTRFMTDSQPFELMVDAYPIHADIPVNTSYIPASAADSTGVVPFNNDPVGYNTLLQPQFDHMTNNIFLPAIETANGRGINWWYVAQVHGELDSATGQYRACDVGNSRMLRPPSPAEIRAMVSLALAYGAKGIFYFSFPTWSDTTGFGECASVRFPGLVDEGSEFGTPDHSDNYDTINNINVFTGYQAKYDAVTAINSDLAFIGPELANLNWQGARTSGDSPGNSIVQGISGGDYIEIGDFIHQPSNEDYFLLVNRRCDDSDTQTLTVTLASSGSRRLIEDVLASRMPWDGNGNRVAYHTLEAGNNTFTVTLNPGEGRLFRVTSGLSDTLTTNRYWSGEPYVINNLTVNPGITLNVERGVAVKFASTKRLTINGSLQALGTSSQGITFDRVGSTGTWSGIWIENSTAASNLNYCTARNASNAIRLRYTTGTVTIDHATLTNNTLGFVPEYSGPWTIQNSTLQNNSYGIYANGFGESGDLYILSNVITQNSVHGVYLFNGVDAYLGFNTITSNCTNTTQAGVYCKTNSDPFMRSIKPEPDYGNNHIHDNNGAGVKAESNSYPQLGRDYQYGEVKDYYGYNEIYENDGAEVYNGNTSGTIVAERNYWAANHNQVPNPDFYGSVDYIPYLGGPPTGLASIFPSPDMNTQAIDFEAAFALELQDQLQTAADLYAKLLESDRMADNVGFGISGLLRCYKGLGRRSDIVPLLDDFILRFPKTALAADAQDHSLPYLVSVGRVDDALAHALVLLQQNRNAADKEPDYLFRTASLYVLKSQGKTGNDLTNALGLYQELLEKFASSDFAFLAQVEVEQLGVSGFAKAAPETSLPISSSQSFALYPNHPNPFNPETQIKFFLEQEQLVTLRVYDVCGRLVLTLLDGTCSQGEHVVSWNGRDERGANVASGIYFYELLAGEKRQRMKMTLAH